MRYGIFSDVHGNLEALNVVLADVAAQKVDRIVFLGDAVGYGADPEAVVTTIREVAHISIMGNHDLALIASPGEEDAYYEAAREALRFAKKQLSDANLAWLKARPFIAQENEVAFCHASPAEPEAFEYLFTAEQALALTPVAEQLAPITFIGHSHLPIGFSLHDGDVEALVGPSMTLNPARKSIVTVGSVGQPRDRDPRACYGVYDGDTHLFEYHRLTYDVGKTRQKILDAGLAAIFADRLLVGI